MLHTLASRCPVFRGMNESEISEILSSVKYQLKQYASGVLFTTEGTPCTHVDIIIHGEMKADMMGPSFKQAQISLLHDGEMLAPAFIYSSNNAMPVSLETTQETTILRMSPDEFRKLMEREVRIAMNFIRMLSDTNVFLSRKVRVLGLYSVREKVADFLVEEARRQQSRTVHMEKTRQEIADTLGIQKFSLIRCLNEFQENGAIAIEGKTIRVLDANKMK